MKNNGLKYPNTFKLNTIVTIEVFVRCLLEGGA